jgi:hypothetical protein
MNELALAIVVRRAVKGSVPIKGRCLRVLRKPKSLIVIVVTLLTYGCPVQAIVHALDLDERTVAAWRDRAGTQCQNVHEAIVEQGKLDLVHVQAGADPGQGSIDSDLDGTGHDGFHEAVAGGSSESHA